MASLRIRVKVVEERDEVEAELDPALTSRLLQLVVVHDGRRIVDARSRHHRSVYVPADSRVCITSGCECGYL